MSLGSMGGSMGDAVPGNGVGVVGGFEASRKEEVCLLHRQTEVALNLSLKKRKSLQKPGDLIKGVF